MEPFKSLTSCQSDSHLSMVCYFLYLPAADENQNIFMVAVDYFIPALILIFGSLAILMIKLMHILCHLLIFIQCYSILLSRLHEKFVSGNLVLIIRVPGIFCTIIYHKSLSVVRVLIFCLRKFSICGKERKLQKT